MNQSILVNEHHIYLISIVGNISVYSGKTVFYSVNSFHMPADRIISWKKNTSEKKENV